MNETTGVALITGGASGIGLALARALGARGTVILGDLDEQSLNAAIEDLRRMNIEAHGRRVDVRSLEELEGFVDMARSFGPITTACLNAGVTESGTPAWETTADQLDFILEVNIRGLFNSVIAVVRHLISQPTPSAVVVTASMAGLVTTPGSAAYSASKAAAVAVSRVLRAELAAAAPQVHVAVLNPGMVKTNIMRTSAAVRSGSRQADSEATERAHAVLNDKGSDPDDVARWVLDAIDAGRFWVLPPGPDPFIQSLAAELGELQGIIAGGAA